MSCYVDILRSFGWKLRGRETQSCHLIADSLYELHELASKIGLKRAWFQDKASFPHYDLVPAKRALAIQMGVTALDTHAFVAKMKELRNDRKKHNQPQPSNPLQGHRELPQRGAQREGTEAEGDQRRED